MNLDYIFCLKNKTGMITGAASGIGRHFAVTLAKMGCNLILIDKNNEKLDKTKIICSKYDVTIVTIYSDISINKNIEEAIALAKKNFTKVDLFINSAGVGGVHKDILEFTENDWDNIIDTNLKAAFFICQAIAKWMIETSTPGKIINISSAAAYHTTTIRSIYSISKIGVESLTRNLALSLSQHGINVNCIAPGFVETELSEEYLKTNAANNELKQIPMNRPGKLHELEGILLLLSSDASSYISGTTFHIDGGCAINKT